MKLKIKAFEVTAEGSAEELAEIVSSSARLLFGSESAATTAAPAVTSKRQDDEPTGKDKKPSQPIGFLQPPESRPRTKARAKKPRKPARSKTARKPRKVKPAAAEKTTQSPEQSTKAGFVPPSAGSKRTSDDIDRMTREAIRGGATNIGQVATAIEASWTVASRSVSRLVSFGIVVDEESGLRIAAGQ